MRPFAISIVFISAISFCRRGDKDPFTSICIRELFRRGICFSHRYSGARVVLAIKTYSEFTSVHSVTVTVSSAIFRFIK